MCERIAYGGMAFSSKLSSSSVTALMSLMTAELKGAFRFEYGEQVEVDKKTAASEMMVAIEADDVRHLVQHCDDSVMRLSMQKSDWGTHKTGEIRNIWDEHVI